MRTLCCSHRMTYTQRALFPGSFDPPTNGHIDIIRRSLGLFDQVLVAILNNPTKNGLFSVAERQAFLRAEFAAEPRVEVLSFSGLLVDFARQQGVNVVVRGLRTTGDYEYEAQMALMNRTLSPSLETVFLLAREESSFISSSLVKQVALLGGDVQRFVPRGVLQALLARRAEC
jgi:pantetheine-phosphate adenylyltransferase